VRAILAKHLVTRAVPEIGRVYGVALGPEFKRIVFAIHRLEALVEIVQPRLPIARPPMIGSGIAKTTSPRIAVESKAGNILFVLANHI
jgi:hypothetical protein